MPNLGGGLFSGIWDTYEALEDLGYPDDETAISDAIDEMFTLCGNPGQEALIGDLVSDFEDWALDALEVEGDAMDFDSFGEMVLNDWYLGREDKWQGTADIWQVGWQRMADQSGYHDEADEYGEGAGEQFY